jgi:hypothetical protein
MRLHGSVAVVRPRADVVITIVVLMRQKFLTERSVAVQVRRFKLHKYERPIGDSVNARSELPSRP